MLVHILVLIRVPEWAARSLLFRIRMFPLCSCYVTATTQAFCKTDKAERQFQTLSLSFKGAKFFCHFYALLVFLFPISYFLLLFLSEAHFSALPSVLCLRITLSLLLAEIASSLGKGVHFNTFGGNPVACAIGSSVLDVSSVFIHS